MPNTSSAYDAEFLRWKRDPAFWSAVAAVRTAKSAGAVETRQHCEQLVYWGGPTTERFGLPVAPEGTFAYYVCLAAFGEDAMDPEPDSPAFDAAFYLAVHPDLQAAFGQDNFKAAAQHWRDYGMSEGRRSSPAFDVRFYVAEYADLHTAFAPDRFPDAVRQWLAHHGIDEARRGCDLFDINFYLDRFPELRADGVRAATRHWVEYGLHEGRQGSPDFDATYYLKSYPDLVATFGPQGYWQSAVHWIVYGKSEGRKAVL